MITESKNDVLAFLRRDPLQYMVHLKVLQTYAVTCCYSDKRGILILLPTQASPWDFETYPSAKYVVLLTGSPAGIRELEGILPRDCDLVFKLIDEPTKTVIRAMYPGMEWQRSFVSYTTETPFPPAPEVVISDTLDPRCLDLYVAIGHDRASIEAYFTKGAQSFTIYAGENPLSTAFVFPNFETIWEFGGLHTVHAARRRGYGRKVTQVAINTLLASGRIPRYHVEEINLPSVQLAESLGLRRCLRIEHFLRRH